MMYAIGARVNAFFAVVLIASCAAAETPIANTRSKMSFVVTDYGANGKDDKKDTAAFQKAIDACSAAGGGVVETPAGNYLLGTVYLKDNVTINLQGGAVIRASTDQADYPINRGAPDSKYQRQYGENVLTCRWAVFYAYRAKNIAITGHGKVLGFGRALWPRFTPNGFRAMMITLEDCENVAIRDITIEDSTCYGGWIVGCRYVRIANVTILNDLNGPNTDGFHFSSCRNVHLTDCVFVCGDDCIAIDSNHRGASANFTITGCAFKTRIDVFRIFSGLDPGLPPKMPRGQVSDISASNCTVEDASGVFNVTASGGDIERLTFSNFSINMNIDYRGSALFFMTSDGGSIRDVTLNSMVIRTDGAGSIVGESSGKISNITLDGIRYELYPRTKLYGNGLPDPLPNYGVHMVAPYNLYMRHVEDVKLHNIQFHWREADLTGLDKTPGGKSSWSCIECNHVHGLDIDGVACSPYGKGSPAIQLGNATDVMISGCRARPDTETFLHVAGAAKGISLMNNDLSAARKVVAMAAGTPPTAVFESGNRMRSPQ